MESPDLNFILLVDDDKISNIVNKHFIRKLDLDVDVEVALNGKEAINFLHQLSLNKLLSSVLLPCLILLDLKMPEMDGWEFLKVYEQNFDEELRSKISIVVLTTSEFECDKIRAMKNPNILEFIKKPMSEDIFMKLVNTYFVKGNYSLM